MKINYNQMMKQAQKMQQDMLKAQEELKNETIEATAGGGVVKVIANGHGEINSIEIKPEVVDPDDTEMLQDLVLVAVNEAIEKAKAMQEERLKSATGGMAIPGMM
jgi:DNA-binding YbaB/EbfC family protein